MNKYSLKDYLSKKLSGYESTFRETSLDKENNQNICHNTTEVVYDFDKFVRHNHPKKQPASPDAIYIGNKKFYFVEFKNSKTSNITNSEIRSKFISGTKILQGLLQDFTARDNKFIFCVVYKSSSKPKYMNYSHIEKNISKFGLDEENKKLDNFYNEIITQNVDFYKRQFNELQC